MDIKPKFREQSDFDILRQVSGIKYLNQMSTYDLACGDGEIT